MLKLILWDLDGTLANSMPTTIEAFRKGIEPYLGKPFTTEDFKRHAGASEEKMIRNIVGEEKAEACINEMRHHMQLALASIHLFEGIRETLEHLHRKIPMGVYTGRGRYGADQVVKHLQIESFFALVLTSDDVLKHKPDPEGVLKACAHFGVRPEETVMIGDSPLDILAGKAAGVQTIACTWDPLVKAGNELTLHHLTHLAHYVVTHPREVLDLV